MTYKPHQQVVNWQPIKTREISLAKWNRLLAILKSLSYA